MHRRRSFPCLLLAQAQVAFNDNAAKLMLVGLAQQILTAPRAGFVVNLLAGLLILPFVLFAPVVGWLADRFAKSRVLNGALLFQVVIMLWLCGSLAARSLPLAIIGFLLLGVQASVFSPAKYGILKELVGTSRLGLATGCLEMLTVAAILFGGMAGGRLFDTEALRAADVWRGALKSAGWLTGASVLAWAVFQGVERTAPQSAEPFESKLFLSHFKNIAEIWRRPPLRLAALGVAYFNSMGGLLYLLVIQLGRDLHPDRLGAASEAGVFLLLLGIGVASGSLAAAALCRRRIELGLVPIGGLGITLSLLWLGGCPIESDAFKAGLVVLGFAAGCFNVPLNAFLQSESDDEMRGRVISATNLLSNLGGLAAVGIQCVLAVGFKLSGPQQILVLVLPSIAVAAYVVWLLPESLLRLFGTILCRCIYKVRASGVENIPSKGGALLICNHVSYVDAVVLQLACPRPIRFLAFEDFHRRWWLGWALRIFQVIPISPRHAKGAIQSAADRLKSGELVCIFPEGEMTRTGVLLGLRKGFELMARRGEAPVIPVYLDRLWGSVFSFSDHRFFWKFPRTWPYPAGVHFGPPIPAEKADVVSARQALLDLGEAAFQNREALKGHLGRACFEALTRTPWKSLIIDRTAQRKRLSRGMALAAAIALARRWKNIPEKRVAIVLPPGAGGMLANLALVLADKVPVNLNFTAGKSAIQSSIRRGEIERVVTATAVQKRFQDFPWPSNLIDLPTELKAIGKPRVLAWLAAVWLVPSAVLARLLRLPQIGDDLEAGLLFTSGSSGEPKGVVLSHRNILGNCAQIAGTGIILRRDNILAFLPLFHSFGFTVTLWYPILEGVEVITVPSPLDTKKIGDAARDEKATVILGTPTFLRSYLRKIPPGDFASVRFAIAGAEKLPPDLVEAYREKFNVEIMEGYGLTETSPVTSVNIPNPPVTTRTASPQFGHRAGSVGRLLPGMTARIVDPESGAELSPLSTGMLQLAGPNIFSGYLGEPEKTAAVKRGRWF
ncbi:MAG: MFS transporter, partial [Verrucomicrobiae bacterium]|nr:MFS transporter [Verrucomicrobiae bacterium]